MHDPICFQSMYFFILWSNSHHFSFYLFRYYSEYRYGVRSSCSENDKIDTDDTGKQFENSITMVGIKTHGCAELGKK